MPNKNPELGLIILYGITFISPVTYSVIVLEMDNIQRMFFYALSILLFSVFFLKYKSDDVVAMNKLILITILLFPFSFLSSIFNSSYSLLPLQLSNIIVPLSIVIQTVVVVKILGGEKFFKVISYAVVIFTTIFSVIGLLEVFQIRTIPLPSVIPPGSTLGHRSFAAEYLLSALPFFLILNEYVKKERKIILLVTAVITVSFLLFTRNRAGIVILIVLTIIYVVFILSRKEQSRGVKIILPVLLVIVISFFISLIPVKGTERPNIQSTASTFFDPDFKSNILRINFWESSLQMIKENPLSGVGTQKWSGYSPKYFGDYFNDQNLTYIHNIHAHNDFLELFAESGIVAFLIFLLIYIYVVLSLLNKVRYDKKYFYLLLTFLVTAAYSLVAFPNHKFSSYFLAAVSAGVSVIFHSGPKKFSIKIKFNNLKWALFAVLIIGGITSFIRLKSEINFIQAMYLKERRQYSLMVQKLENVSGVFYPMDASKQPVDYYRGIANYFLGNQKEALRNNLSAQKFAPFSPIVLRNLAGSYQLNNQPKKALEVYNRIKKYFPNYIEAQINLLYLYSKQGQAEKEQTLFEELLQKFPDNPYLIDYKKKSSK